MMNFSKTLASRFRPQRFLSRGYTSYDCDLYMGQLEGFMDKKPVKILSTRIAKPGREFNIKKYLGDLNKKVKNYEGFENAESYWVPMTQNSLVAYQSRRMITISSWESRAAWNKWLKSECRKKSNKKFEEAIEAEEHMTLEYIPPPPIFLL